MEQFKQKLALLRDEANKLNEDAESKEAELKRIRDLQVGRDQDILSLKSRMKVLEADLLRFQKSADEHTDSTLQANNGKGLSTEDLNNNILNLEGQIEEVRTQIQEKKDELHKLEINSERYERQIKNLEKDVDLIRDNNLKKIQEKHTKMELELKETMAMLSDI